MCGSSSGGTGLDLGDLLGGLYTTIGNIVLGGCVGVVADEEELLLVVRLRL